jgi:hypothetical protein
MHSKSRVRLGKNTCLLLDGTAAENWRMAAASCDGVRCCMLGEGGLCCVRELSVFVMFFISLGKENHVAAKSSLVLCRKRTTRSDKEGGMVVVTKNFSFGRLGVLALNAVQVDVVF